jgi:hypothetical protein
VEGHLIDVVIHLCQGEPPLCPQGHSPCPPVASPPSSAS